VIELGAKYWDFSVDIVPAIRYNLCGLNATPQRIFATIGAKQPTKVIFWKVKNKQTNALRFSV
jgi:hypothetical protein